MNRAQPEQQAPPVQRLRVRYAKRGRMRFTSHRDFSRAFERALVRARVPMAYSSGFNPHPRISYAGASPTGSASEAEYLEIGLAQVLDPADVARTLAGLQRHTEGPVLASRLKRAILRKDPTFDEADHGFRSFTELLRQLAALRGEEQPGGARNGHGLFSRLRDSFGR